MRKGEEDRNRLRMVWLSLEMDGWEREGLLWNGLVEDAMLVEKCFLVEGAAFWLLLWLLCVSAKEENDAESGVRRERMRRATEREVDIFKIDFFLEWSFQFRFILYCSIYVSLFLKFNSLFFLFYVYNDCCCVTNQLVYNFERYKVLLVTELLFYNDKDDNMLDLFLAFL